MKKGGYVGITLEMIDKDRVSAVRSIPRKIGLAAYRTVSTLVSALFTANAGIGPTLADTGALFNATATSSTGGHANLLTSALSLDAWERRGAGNVQANRTGQRETDRCAAGVLPGTDRAGEERAGRSSARHRYRGVPTTTSTRGR